SSFAPKLKNKLSSYSISDEATKEAIKEVYQQYNYLLDPHGAVGYIALKDYLHNHPTEEGMILETAHPVKFNPAIIDILGENILAQKEQELLLNGVKQSIFMENSYHSLKEILLAR
ncbi:MAG: threonine synthase, partial [Chitinophagaceae bacterium]|nr:threonine synthase [Chitinophagaceae bacterium]